MSVTGAYRFTHYREPDLAKWCGESHPVFLEMYCNRTTGHDGKHRYTSPADGRYVEWPDDPDREGQPF